MLTQLLITRMLAQAGITVNGHEPWDIRVHDRRFFRRALLGGSLGLGESYEEGWWGCERLDLFFERIFRSNLHRIGAFIPSHLIERVRSTIADHGAASNSRAIGKAHYDLGNDLYAAMLGPSMAYTCAYWPNATTLDEAQFAKLDLVCRKIRLRPGDNVLDVGCGFGSWAKFAAKTYGASVTGITVSKQQAIWGNAWCKGLPVTLEVKDYREMNGSFDHIVSIGMFEHVESPHYAEYFRTASALLRPGGLFLLHTIGNPGKAGGPDPYIRHHIFPTGEIPTRRSIETNIDGLFEIRDWHEFELSFYDRTLMAWHANFVRAWPDLSAHYDERFRRRREYYLQSCAAAFRTGNLRLWQVVLAHPGEHRDYVPVR
jgi:cyclopropane-fatty-acyl-phospholipid synthase